MLRLLSFILLGVSLLASEEASIASTFQVPIPLIEAKGAYFFFANEKLRDVYSSGGFQVQISGAYPVYYALEVYGSVGYSQAFGSSTGAGESTTIWQLPVDIGLRPVFRVASFAEYYFTIGPRYFYVHQYNNSSYVKESIGKSRVGLFVNTGFNFTLLAHMLIDVFGEYAYEPISFSNSSDNIYGNHTQVSTFSFGAGLGYNF